jgi:D-amino peptidase
MKILISLDFEGLAGVVNWRESDSKSPRYHHICQQATAEVNAAIAGAREADPAVEFIVTDAHGEGTNILTDELDPAVTLVRGSPRTLYMVEGIAEGVDAAFFIGYHSMAGAASSPMDHTYAGSVVYRLTVNGVECSELDVNVRLAGHYGARLGLVSGNEELCLSARERYGDAFPIVATKRGLSRFAAECRPESVVVEEIRRAAVEAVRRFDDLPVVAEETPVICEIDFLHTAMADVCAKAPTVERTGGRSVRYESPDMPSAYTTFSVCVALGGVARNMGQ